MSRYSDAVSDEGVDPESDAELTVVYAVEADMGGLWDIYHAEDRSWLDAVLGNQHDLVEYCLSAGYDLRDGPLSAY
jgi:hypothetical protein